MRIGIDVSRAGVVQPTGTERYCWEVITHILALPEAGKHEWILYTRISPSSIPPLKLRGGRGSYIKLSSPRTLATTRTMTKLAKTTIRPMMAFKSRVLPEAAFLASPWLRI